MLAISKQEKLMLTFPSKLKGAMSFTRQELLPAVEFLGFCLQKHIPRKPHTIQSLV